MFAINASHYNWWQTVMHMFRFLRFSSREPFFFPWAPLSCATCSLSNANIFTATSLATIIITQDRAAFLLTWCTTDENMHIACSAINMICAYNSMLCSWGPLPLQGDLLSGSDWWSSSFADWVALKTWRANSRGHCTRNSLSLFFVSLLSMFRRLWWWWWSCCVSLCSTNSTHRHLSHLIVFTELHSFINTMVSSFMRCIMLRIISVAVQQTQALDTAVSQKLQTMTPPVQHAHQLWWSASVILTLLHHVQHHHNHHSYCRSSLSNRQW